MELEPTPPCRLVSRFESMNAGKRPTQEDSMFVLERFGPDEAYTLAALFDGHGGRGTVDYVSHALPRNLAAILQNPEAQADAERALRAAFLLTDVQTARFVADTSGSTAVCCLATRDAERGGALTLVLANCGDSRAVLCHDGRAERLTYDHKAEDPSEQCRVTELGGFVHGDRTLGVLAVARSFGDHAFKKFVTADPFLCTVALAPCADAPFLILCCDGVWDVMSDAEAVALVAKGASSSGAPGGERGAAKLLVQEAVKRGSSDNLSAMVLFF